MSFNTPSVLILTPTQRVPLKFNFTTLVLSNRVRFGLDNAGRRKRARCHNSRNTALYRHVHLVLVSEAQLSCQAKLACIYKVLPGTAITNVPTH
jgi:hypothetical protein